MANARLSAPPLVDCILALGLLCGSVGTLAASADSRPTTDRRVEVLWDTFGVPHLFAADLPSLYYGFGWAQMRNHGNLILRLYGEARGRAAEYWGGDEELEHDRLIHVLGIPERAQNWLRQQSAEFGPCLAAFVAGMNAFAQAQGDELDSGVKPVLPVEATDVLAHCQRDILLDFVAGDALGQTRNWQGKPGSNAWAVAPARSASGHALLLANPHLPWDGLFLWFEAQWHAPGLEAYGATLVGYPVLAIAFNNHLGWTHTVNTLDGADLYELTLRGDGYEWDGAQRAFATSRHVLKQKLRNGAVREEELVIRNSVHGPVVAQRDGRALALRSVGWESPNASQQYLDMLRAGNLSEFERAVRRLQVPMFTIIYADRDGHILHLFNGQVPVRPPGAFNWSGIVPGNTAQTLWTRSHGYDDLPRIVDPRSGWLQNANDPPWTTTYPPAINPDKFPAYMAPRGMWFRPQTSSRLLMETNRLSLDELVARKHSTRMEVADRILDDLLAAAATDGSATNRAAAAVLRKWDRCADAASRGAVLFAAFYDELLRRAGASGAFARAWDPKDPLHTPRGLAHPARALGALEAAARKVLDRHGALDIEWGAVHRLRRDGLDLPANGGPDGLGIFRALWGRADKDGMERATGGDSYVCAVEFANPVRARALLSYGNASQPGSKHRTDQLELFARKALRPVWLSRPEIEQHLETRERP